MTTPKRLPRPRDPIQLGKLIGDIYAHDDEDLALAGLSLQKATVGTMLDRVGA